MVDHNFSNQHEILEGFRNWFTFPIWGGSERLSPPSWWVITTFSTSTPSDFSTTTQISGSLAGFFEAYHHVQHRFHHSTSFNAQWTLTPKSPEISRKSGTITTLDDAHNFTDMKYRVSPVVKVAVKPKDPKAGSPPPWRVPGECHLS